MTRFWSLRAAVAALLLSSCGLINELSKDRVVGAIITDTLLMGGGLRTIVAPDTVRRATPVTITVNSFGSSSCTDPDGVDLVSEPLLMRITPYDRVQRAGACTADFATQPHPVQLQFPVAGAALIRVVGRAGPNGLDSIQQPIHVRP